MTQQPLITVEHVINVLDNVNALSTNARTLDSLNSSFTDDSNEWDRVLLEMKNDFEDGLKSILAIRKTFDAHQEVR